MSPLARDLQITEVPYFFSVLAIQAKKKRYKAPKARMKPDDSKSKPKRYCSEVCTAMTTILSVVKIYRIVSVFVTSSGSVSSFNEEDYEVDENSDEEEQEEPGDYIKGTLCTVWRCFQQLCLKFMHNDSDLRQTKLLTRLERCRGVYSSLFCLGQFSWEFSLSSMYL